MSYNNWRKTVKSTIALSKKNPSQSTLHNKAKKLALKYYGTEDIASLQPYQIDKIVSWTTGTKPDKGKNQQRKATKALHKGKWYKNSTAKTQAILNKEYTNNT